MLQALQIMRQSGVDSLLVVDGRDRLLGVLWLEELMSEKDGSGSAETYLSDDYVAVGGYHSQRDHLHHRLRCVRHYTRDRARPDSCGIFDQEQSAGHYEQAVRP